MALHLIIMDTDTAVIQAPQDRLRAHGRAEQSAGMLTGRESVEELRNLIIQMTAACLDSKERAACPLRTLSGLTYASMSNLVHSLPRSECLDLIYQACVADCRAQASCRRVREQARGRP